MVKKGFCSLLTSLILGLYYKLNWPKRASAVYWLLGTLLFPCIRYIYTCFFFLTHLPLHLLLAIHEYNLYWNFNLFHEMCSWALRATVYDGTLKRAKILPETMGAIQGAFGFFLLVDITLMLIYWLLHTYHAYFSFQVILKGMNNFLVIKFHCSCFQEGVLPAIGSALIIMAEFSRIFLLTNASSKYRL